MNNTIVLRKIDFLTGSDFIYDNKLPTHMLYLRDVVEGTIYDPSFTAWQRLKALQAYRPLIFSDIYRSPASSADAYRRKTGVALPGYSGHNYGVSIDIDVDGSMKRHNLTYNGLCTLLIAYGWTPYQGIQIDDYRRGKEDWHFNFIGDWINIEKPLDKWINSNNQFEVDITSIQRMLKQLKLYQGELDGIQGPLTRDAIIKFQKAWNPKKLFGSYGDLDEVTVRILNAVSARVVDEKDNLIC